MQWPAGSPVRRGMRTLETANLGRRFVRYMRDPSVSVWRKAAGLAAIAYLVMPFDAVPDVFPVIGWLDDVGVLSAAAMFIVREVKRHAATASSADAASASPSARHS